ncbi:complement receptor type 2-like isoform X2 [Lycorma delicatula]
MQLLHGNITIRNLGEVKELHFHCFPGYRLNGLPFSHVKCRPDNVYLRGWSDVFVKPTCTKACEKPPSVLNGAVFVSEHKEENDLISDGVVAEYSCAAHYKLTPITSQHRICQDGEWTGSAVTCVFEGCARLKGILNGYILLDKSDDSGKITPKETLEGIVADSEFIDEGVTMHYRCNNGFTLNGQSYSKCHSSGMWLPHKVPTCRKNKFNENQTVSSSVEYYPPKKTSLSSQDYFQTGDSLPESEGDMCSFPPLGSHIQILAIQTDSGSDSPKTTNSVSDGTLVEVTCAFGYREQHKACIPMDAEMDTEILHCVKGNWKGHLPNCAKSGECTFPPKIRNGEFESVSGGTGGGRFGIGGQITYTCYPGYQLSGEAVITCQSNGCWEPAITPVCEPQFYLNTNWPEYLNENTSLLFYIVTALSVLFLLLSVCVAVVCRHRPTQLHHHHPSAAAAPPTLVPPQPDPDRVALIAFADDIQSGLPSYEEAIRGGNGGGRGLLSYRLHHPPWSQRRNPRTDTTIVARQLSSTGESMGSTDTMTVSDVSTNVTLDTVSSHTCSSTSQTASCRAICGSLASFDTSSVLNTEGVPLLEENELEENRANTDVDEINALAACDNISFKLQSDIDSIHS